MADIIPLGDNELEPVGGELIPDENHSLKVLRLSRNDERGKPDDFRRLLAAAVQMFSGADLISKVKASMEYIVQVPAEYQADLASGALEMMHGESSGKTWATLVRKLENGKNEIVCNCPVAGEMRVKGNPVESMAGVYQNLHMQQKLAELSAQVQEVFEVVKRIEQGQTDDRIGKLLSGRDDMQRALQNPDKASKIREIELARDKISEAQGQIGQVFRSRIEDFKPIHQSKIVRTLQEIVSPRTNYESKRDEEFHRLEDYFEFYLRATELLASSYTVVGDLKRADMVYQQARSFLGSIDYHRISTLDYIYPKGSMLDAFYHQTDACIEDEKQLCLEEGKPFDFVQLTVTGDFLKEVLENAEAI